jgi:glycosyltransferase involved in cell wall biosynthesis
VRIALVYDCLYPHTVGGAERWLRALAESLAAEHEVTYLTRRQWSGDAGVPGVRCLAVSPGGALYDAEGRRRLLPPVLFGAGVLAHFLRNRRRYDVVHCVSYPFVPLVAIRMALIGTPQASRVYCEWIECLSRDYWRSYAGGLGGTAGRLLQALCISLTSDAWVFSDHTRRRLREEGYRGRVRLAGGLGADVPSPPGADARPGDPFVLFAGRHVPDKRVTILPDAIAQVREHRPATRAVLVGDGPERSRVLERIRQLGLEEVVSAPGFVGRAELDRLYREAACVVSPSRRDGYGMAVVEAAAVGTPVVVCRSPDNAATEHVVEGVNGTVVERATPAELAAGIIDVLERGPALRHSAARWFEVNSERLQMRRSLDRVRALYGCAGASGT